MFFNEVVGKKNKHKNRKAIWFEYMHKIIWVGSQNYREKSSSFCSVAKTIKLIRYFSD
jgi:hypothetical protein